MEEVAGIYLKRRFLTWDLDQQHLEEVVPVERFVGAGLGVDFYPVQGALAPP